MTTTLYTFNCDREKVLNIDEQEVKGLGFDIKEELVQVDIRITGYSNGKPVYITKEHLTYFKELLENGAEPWDMRYKIGLVSSYLIGKPLIINGRYYVDGGNKPNSEKKYLGFGGRKYKYRRFNSDKIIESNNLWNGTVIEDDIRKFIPDNAEWVK